MIAESYEALMDTEADPINVRHFAEKHLALRKELGDLDGQIIAHLYMAINEFWSGDRVQARQLCKAAMEIASIVKNQWGLSEGHSLLGYIYRASGEADKAIEHFQRALAIVGDTGEQGRIVRQLNALGCAYAAKKEWTEAERYIQQAIDMARSNHFALWEVISNINLAEVACTFGETALAEGYYQDAANVDRSREYTFLEDLVAYGNGKAALLHGDPHAAAAFLRQALKAAAETGNRMVMKYSLQALAVCTVRSGEFERAVRLRGLVASRDWLLWPMSMPWLVPYDLDSLLAPTRRMLGEGEYARLIAEGQAMTLEQGVAYALEVQGDLSPPP
jgi:tetratricopeptide (TPR) repeat protein